MSIVLNCIKSNGGMGGNASLDALVNLAMSNYPALTQDQFQQLAGVNLAYFYPVDLGTWAANENALWNCIAAQFGYPGAALPDWFNQGLSISEVIA